MKVFKFIYDGGYQCGISHESQEKAEDYFKEIVSDEIDSVKEIPESDWDEKFIKFHEDNDSSKKGFKMSIREVMEKEPMIIWSNDHSLLD